MRTRRGHGRAVWLAVVVAALLGLPAGAQAGETLETERFALVLPDRWTADRTTSPVSARGPGGELLQLSASSLTGEGSPEDAARIMRQVDEAATRSMRAAELDPTLITVTPLKSRRLAAGGTLHEMLSRTRDGQSLFAQFCATGPRTAVLVTVQLPTISARSVDAIRQSMIRLRWTK